MTQIRREKIFKENVPIDADVQLPEVILWTPATPTRTEKDIKIDSIFLAKAVLDLHLPNLARVNVRYYANKDRTSWEEVSITSGDVKAYAGGAESADMLLKSLAIHRSPVQAPLSTDYSFECRGTMQFGLLLGQARSYYSWNKQIKIQSRTNSPLTRLIWILKQGRLMTPRGVIDLLKHERADKYMVPINLAIRPWERQKIIL